MKGKLLYISFNELTVVLCEEVTAIKKKKRKREEKRSSLLAIPCCYAGVKWVCRMRKVFGLGIREWRDPTWRWLDLLNGRG